MYMTTKFTWVSLDVLKAFDSARRKQIWQSLRKRGIKKKLRNNIKAIYEVIRNYVRKDGEQSEEFLAKEGLRQGEALTPILFIMIMDDVAREIESKIKQTHVGYKCLEKESIEECVFVKNRSDIKCNLMLLKEVLKKRNMNINMEKKRKL